MEATHPIPPRIKFEDCTVAFAVDTSGSTSLNNTLRSEQNAIATIASNLSPSSRSVARVLPWSDDAERPVPLSGLANLESYGGTDPSCLLDDPLSRQTLQKSTMWFLFTDGEIHEHSIQNLARKLAVHGLHGTACVVTIFGRAYMSPASCNISVGVSVFAVAPDCLFLFCDTISGVLYLLQCSGRFSQILEMRNRSQPLLDDNTEWKDLPTIQFADLTSISIPAPRALSKDQVALPDGLVLNLKDLFDGKLNDEATVDRIFQNDDNLKSIMLTAQTRGEADAFRQWLGPFTDPSSSPLKSQSLLEKKAMESIRNILKEMKSGVTDERMQELQSNLRQSHATISSSIGSSTNENRYERASITAMVRSSESTHQSRSLSSITCAPKPVSGAQAPGPVLLTPGFQVPRSPEAMFKSKCELCALDDTNLALLLRKPPSEQVTAGFPEPGTAMSLVCPLAVGNFPETDIISSSICCDNCAFVLAKEDETPLGEPLSCVIPLVTYEINARAYKTQLKLALENRLADDDLPQAFLAIVVNTLQRLPSKDNRKTLTKALKWCCRDLMLNVECTADLLSTHASVSASTKTIRLKTTVAAALKDSNSAGAEGLFQYPLPGFIVMVLGLHYAQEARRPSFSLQNQVWQRLLYQIAQHYHHLESTQGQTLAQYRMADLLIEKGASTAAEDKSARKNSLRSLRELGKSLFGDRSLLLSSSNIKSTVDLESLVEHELLTPADLVGLRSFGEAFTSLELNTGPALCIFLHFLARERKSALPVSAWQRFQTLRGHKTLTGVFKDPVNMAPKLVVECTRSLPPLVRTD